MSVKESWVNDTGLFPKDVLSVLRKLLKNKHAIGKLFTLTLEIIRPTRSIMQLRYYFGVVVKILSEETGYTPEVMHEHLKKIFLGYKEYDMPDGTTHIQIESTKGKTTVEFEDYLKEIRQWSGEFLNCYIPLPNETKFDYTKYEE